MKRLGIVGGIGPESTIEYYRALIRAYRKQVADGSYPEIVINSINLSAMLELISANRKTELAAFLAAEVQRLADAGADLALLASNTPHMVFEDVQRQSPIPLISIVQATAAHAKALGLTKLGLFGTRFTMQARFYADVFSREGISLVVPNEEEQHYIHEKYFGELVNDDIRPDTRVRLASIVDALKQREQIQGLILGGTELSLIFREPTVCGIPVLDTTLIHARAALERILA